MTPSIIKDEKRWYEKSVLIFLYHTAQLIQVGSFKRGRKWRLEDTAHQLELSIGFVSESLTIAKYSERLGLDKCQSRDEALKLCRELKNN